jgi:predicted thioredoxin/glutaredoxin
VADPRHVVTVYPITGRQLFFTVPHSWCEECDLTVRLVSRVTEELPGVEVRIKPWWNHLFDALRRGGWHAPVVTIDGRLFSQGIVPDAGELRAALTDAPSAPVEAQPSELRRDDRDGGRPLLSVYTASDCAGCESALELAEEARRSGIVTVEVINLDELAADGRHSAPAVPLEVVATPAVMVDGRLVSLGTPEPERLDRAIEDALKRRAETTR